MTRGLSALEMVMHEIFALNLSDNLSNSEGKLHLHLYMSTYKY